jgi:hypothetical protein
MKLFDGSGEYRAAYEIKQGDRVRGDDHELHVVSTVHGGGEITSEIVGIVCADGHAFERPGTSRVLVKFR